MNGSQFATRYVTRYLVPSPERIARAIDARDRLLTLMPSVDDTTCVFYLRNARRRHVNPVSRHLTQTASG